MALKNLCKIFIGSSYGVFLAIVLSITRPPKSSSSSTAHSLTGNRKQAAIGAGQSSPSTLRELGSREMKKKELAIPQGCRICCQIWLSTAGGTDASQWQYSINSAEIPGMWVANEP
jgi:hypothetical protein